MVSLRGSTTQNAPELTKICGCWGIKNAKNALEKCIFPHRGGKITFVY